MIRSRLLVLAAAALSMIAQPILAQERGAVVGSPPTFVAGETRPITLDTAGNLRVVTTSSGGTAVGSQGATTAGQMQSLGACATTTAAPTYTTGTTNPVSCDTAGGLRVGATGLVATAAPVYVAGDRAPLVQSTSGSLYTVIGAPGAVAVNPSGGADGAGNTSVGLLVYARNQGWNNATWDRLRTIPGVDGTGLGVQAVATAPSSAAGGALIPAVSSLTNSVVAKTAAGNLYGVEIDAGATALWLYVFNATAAPADGVVVAGVASGNYQYCAPVAAAARLATTYEIPERYSVGVTAVASSTACGTLTKSATPIFMKVRFQ